MCLLILKDIDISKHNAKPQPLTLLFFHAMLIDHLI
jgi:hypothetical protein